MATRLGSVSAALVTVLLAGGLATGCGDSDKSGGKAASRGQSATPSTSAASVSASGTAGSAAPSAPGATGPSGASTGRSGSAGHQDGAPSLTAGPGEITVTGDVEDGVEPGCIVLRGPTETYVLVGGDRDRLATGGRMTVRGKTEVGLMTTCMQGTPLRVLEIQQR